MNSVTVGGVNVDGVLVLATGSTLTLNGDVFYNTGTITAEDNSLVELFGNDLDMSLLNTPSFYDVTVNNTTAAVADQPFGIRGTLSVESGEFETTSTVIMLSDSNGTGRLGPVVGSTFTGDITMQRYIPAGVTNWRLLGSAVDGATVNDWKDDFFTAGFPGSHFPNFYVPLNSTNFWPSIRWYDETVNNASPDTGLVGATSNTQLLAQGQGFAAWCGDNLNTTTDFVIDVTGAPHIAQTPISLPVTYTNTGNAGADGYNLVSNPLPSPVLWSNLDRTNVGPTMFIFNPKLGNTGSYTINSGGTLGVSDTIQSSQAFFVRATAASPVLDIEESDKIVGNEGGLFGGSQVDLFAGIRLRVSSTINQFADETVVAFHMGTPELDGDDVGKIVFAHPDAPQIATRTNDGVGLMVNAYGTYTTEIAIPVAVNVALDGTYTITATALDNVGLSCLSLEDLTTGTITAMTAGATYSFTAGAEDDDTVARFVLRASAPVPMITDDATCFGANNGRGTVINTGGSQMDITWTDAGGSIFLQQTIADGIAATGDLAPGEYNVRVTANTACGELVSPFTISEPAELELLADYSAATCANTEDGLVDLTILGGTAPYTFAWSNGSDTEDIMVAAGDYTVTVTDVNGCALAPQAFNIQVLEELEATATVESNTVEVNLPLAFSTTVEEGTSITWDFGDTNTSDEAAPVHTWTVPGTYTVTLTVDNGNCTATWTTSVVVEMSTSIAPVSATSTLNAWFANDKFVVEHSFSNGEAVVVDVLDATGRLHLTRKAAGVPARINLPADGLATGVWFVRVSNAGTQRTMRVPLVR